MELGQAVFGNPTSEYTMPQEWQHYLQIIGEQVERNLGFNPCGNNGSTAFENDVFEIRGYYWGECDCGYEEEEFEWWESRSHSEECFHSRYRAQEATLGTLPYSKRSDKMTSWSKKNGYPAAPYGMAAYCDCGLHDEAQEYFAAHPHPSTCSVMLPNFRHKATGTEVRWYKYLGRGSTTNNPDADILAIMKDCLKSLEG